jgi:trehalose 6-phosphate synthase/phosphatase
MIARAEALMKKNDFVAAKGHCIVEAKPPVLWNKGRASIYILRTAFGVDWHERVRIIYAGDDATDEDAIQVIA